MDDFTRNWRAAARTRWSGRLLAAIFAASALAPVPALAGPLDWLVPPAARQRPPQPVRTRVLPWPGGERLVVALGADVRYVQGSASKVVVTGPGDLIDDIIVDGGVLRHQRDWRWHWGWGDWSRSRTIVITVTAPRISDAGVSGSGQLALGRLNQDRLDLHVSGSGAATASGDIRSLDVSISGSGSARFVQVNAADMDAQISGSGWIAATGSADALHLGISGSGSAKLDGLAVQDAVAGLSGSGSATIAPKRSADLHVSGSGSIRLATSPPQLTTHRSGSGSIIRPGGIS
jgi:hypothetical protein